MALSTYTELLEALGRLSLRPTDQVGNWPDFIRLAEARMEREFRTRQMTLRADGTLDEEFEDLPSDFAEVVSFRLMTSPARTLKFLDAGQMASLSTGGSPGGNPQFYSIVGPQFRFWPVPAESVVSELTYFQRLPPLSENEQNWVLYRHPDAYYYGALIPYGEMAEDTRLPTWERKFVEAVEAIQRSDHAMGDTLAPRPALVV